MPATSPPLTSINSVFQPRDSHQCRYMRSSISAQSCASVPPAPAWISTKAFAASILPENIRWNSSLPTSASTLARSAITDCAAFIQWFNKTAAKDEDSSLMAAKCYHSGNHGWMEFIDQKDCRDEKDVRNFYY